MKQTQHVKAPPEVKAWLIVHGGPQDGRTFRLRPAQNVITIGTDSKLADFVLEDPSISRQHIRLRFERSHFTLTDLASLNGTFVNAKQVQSHLLMDNDIIRIGNTTLVYKYIAPDWGQ